MTLAWQLIFGDRLELACSGCLDNYFGKSTLLLGPLCLWQCLTWILLHRINASNVLFASFFLLSQTGSFILQNIFFCKVLYTITFFLQIAEKDVFFYVIVHPDRDAFNTGRKAPLFLSLSLSENEVGLRRWCCFRVEEMHLNPRLII